MKDTIYRQDAIKAIGDIHPLDYSAQSIKTRIEGLPSAEKMGKWVLGEELNMQGIIPPRGTACRHFKGDTRKFWDALTYCSECYQEAYCDTDYGDQLFEYCPYCGSHMENGGEDDE